MKLEIIEQRSDEWFAARLGKVSCSRLGDMLASTKSGLSASRKNYLAELVCQRLTGKREETFQSAAMQWGTDNEPLARCAYEVATGLIVTEHGGTSAEAIADFWGSPDGLVGEDGGVEIKCPNTATHIETLFSGQIKQEYIYQMAGLCWIYNRQWWDFVSYDPRLPDRLAMYRKRFTREELPIDIVVDGVKAFIIEINEMVAKLEALK